MVRGVSRIPSSSRSARLAGGCAAQQGPDRVHGLVRGQCRADRPRYRPIGIALAEILEMPRLDGIASLGIGVVLAATAAFLAYESQSLLTGEAVHPEVRAEIERIAKMAPGVIGTNQVLTMHFGPHEVLAALSLDFDDRRSAGDVEAAVSRIEREIKAAFPEVTRVFIEAKDRNAPSQTETPV